MELSVADSLWVLLSAFLVFFMHWERSERLGGLIATCATCHRAMGVGAFAQQAIEAGDPIPTRDDEEE